MSKNIPYFKFYSDEWNSGLIVVEPMEAQGLFVNICSLIWSNGELSVEHICKRFQSKCQTDVKQLLSSLEADGLITIADAKIEVKFIKKTMIDYEQYSKQQSAKGRKGGLQRKQNVANKIIEDKIRKDIEKKNNTIVLLKEKVADAPVVSSETPQKTKILFKKPTEEEVMEYGFAFFGDEFDVGEGQAFYDYFESNGWKVSGKSSMKDWQAALRNWHRNKEKFRKVR